MDCRQTGALIRLACGEGLQDRDDLFFPGEQIITVLQNFFNIL
jgi:hypothetical protein